MMFTLSCYLSLVVTCQLLVEINLMLLSSVMPTLQVTAIVDIDGDDG